MAKKIIVGLVIVVVSWLMVSLLITYVTLQLGKATSPIFTWLPDSILRLFWIDVSNLPANTYPALISVITLTVGFLITITPIFAVFRRTGKLRQEVRDAQQEFLSEHGITINPVKKKGTDDLEWMLPHYEQAGRVIVCAGSFDWLGGNEQMKKRIHQLAAEDHLKLVSYKTKEQVKAAFRRKGEQKLFRELEKHFAYESGLEGVTCTMIQKLGADWEFLYRSRADAENVFNVSYISTTPRNIELLNILAEFAKVVERRSVHISDSSPAKQG